MSDETNLSGVDFETAKNYILSYMTTLKQTQKEITETKGECELWSNRVSLAESKGMADLSSQAKEKLGECVQKLDTLMAEENDLKTKISRMREQLPMVKAGERSIDADQLLAELQMVTGELLNPGAAKTDEELKKLGADAELERMKANMKDEK